MFNAILKNFSKSDSLTFIVAIIFVFGAMGVFNVNGNSNIHPTSLSKKVVNQSLSNSFLNNTNYKWQFNYLIPQGEADYYPKQNFKQGGYESVLHQKIRSSSNVHINKISYLPNHIVYSMFNKNTSKVDLPILAYHSTYSKNNGRISKYQISRRGTVMITRHKGKNIVEAGFDPGLIFYVCVFITTIAWLLIIFQCLRRHKHVEKVY